MSMLRQSIFFAIVSALFLFAAGSLQADMPTPNVPVGLTVGKAQTVDIPVKVSNVLVSNPQVADIGAISKNKFYVVGRNVGDTNILMFDNASDLVATLDINVRVDEANLQRTLDEFFPGENIKPKTINNNIVLTGKVSNPSKAGQIREIAGRFSGENETIVDMMTVDGEQQVLLKVKIVEAERSLLRELGIDALQGTTGQIGNFTGNFAGNAAAALSSAPYMSGSLVWQTGSHGPLNALIQAIEEENLINTLAEPNLTTISGKTAQFLAGGEYPVPVSNNDGQIGIEFKEFGVGLGFTPVVNSNNRISMNLQTEVSSLSNQGELELQNTQIPSLTVRRAETVVELPSGGSLLIAGLIQSDSTNTLNSLPGISQIPILGSLFSSQSFQRNESELLVLVTAYVVEPIAEGDAELVEGAVETPEQGVQMPLEQTFMHNLEQAYGETMVREMTRGGVSGYVLD